MGVTVGSNFLCLFLIKKLPSTWVVLLMVMVLWVCFSTRKEPQRMARHTSWSLLNATRLSAHFATATVRQWTQARYIHIYNSFTRCSQPSGDVLCSWRWYLRKPVLSTGQSKLMKNCFMKSNLYVKSSDNAFVYHFILTFFFKVSSGQNSVAVQNIT